MANRKQLEAMAKQKAAKYKIPYGIFKSLITHESGWNPNARSPVGAIGLGQLMPGTARGLGVDPNDPADNLEGAAKYLAGQFRQFKRWDFALAAYNAGPGAVSKYGGIPPYEETRNYVAGIMGDAKKQGLTATSAAAPAQEAPRMRGVPGLPQMPGGGMNLRQAMAQAAPTEATRSILERLGGTAARASESAQQEIALPQGIQQLAHQGAMEIPGSEDTKPEVTPGQPAAKSGFNAMMEKRLNALFAAVREAGGEISVYSGARDAKKQAVLYRDAVRKYGSEAAARKWVAPPGKSNHDTHAGLKHGFGDGALAADLRGDLAIAHKLAPQFGLVFPLANEAWHIELAGARGK